MGGCVRKYIISIISLVFSASLAKVVGTQIFFSVTNTSEAHSALISLYYYRHGVVEDVLMHALSADMSTSNLFLTIRGNSYRDDSVDCSV
jgi:hypothetical protein